MECENDTIQYLIEKIDNGFLAKLKFRDNKTFLEEYDWDFVQFVGSKKEAVYFFIEKIVSKLKEIET